MSKEIIKQFGDRLVDDVKKALPKVSGNTAASVKIDYTDDGFTITGNASIGALVNGRKPTKSGAKKGSPTLQESILEWVQALSIQPREESMTQLQLSWAISNSIHRKGTIGRPDMFDDVLNSNRFDSLAKTLLNEQTTVISSQILKQWQ
ncbi:MAG TPA: hypothetical protein PK833_06810 [Vicingus sp.]|nr:hypothetical protein [Vicingus sp.]